MNIAGLSQLLSVRSARSTCPHCNGEARLDERACVRCLLAGALELEEPSESDNLNALLAQVDVRDTDWRLGNYQILEEIGRGGMGVIYRARQRHSKRIVALKRLLSYHGDSRETLERFRREAEAAASLDHSNILPIYEVGEEEGLPFFTMKYAGGGSLQRLSGAYKDNPRECVRLLLKVTRAVSYAHGEGILHRDIKPGNILLDGHGEPMVSDFGLAKWLDRTTDLTRTLTVFGTPGYVAPEQATCSHTQLTPAADIYSLGALLFDLLTGRPPFLGEHALSIIKQAEEKSAPKLRSFVRSADRDLETTCAKCLERDPELRYRSAADLAEDLQRWLEGRSIVARRVSAPVKLWRWSKRNRLVAASLVGSLLVGGVAAVVQAESYSAKRTAAMTMHSIAVERFLDLDAAAYNEAVSRAMAATLQSELIKHGPAHVTAAPGTRTTRQQNEPSRSTRARTIMEGTKRTHNGKVRVSLRLLDAADRKILYKDIFEGDSIESAAFAAARLLYHKLDVQDLTSAEVIETDPAWRDEKTRQLLIAGRAVDDRRTAVDGERAIQLFEEAVKQEPQSALAYSCLAEAHCARGFFSGDSKHLSAAEHCIATALQLNPKAAETHKAASMARFQQGRFDDSVEEAFTAIELANEIDDYRLLNRIPGPLRLLGRPDKAVPWYAMAFQTNARPYTAYSLADCYTDLTDDEKASAQYRRAASLFPEMAEGWVGLCHLALLKRDFPNAKSIASEKWSQYRDSPVSEPMAAQVEFYSRNFADAERLYGELINKDPEGGASFYGCISYRSALGCIRLKAGDRLSGEQLLTAALSKENDKLHSAPRHPETLYRIAAIESSLGRRQSALKNLSAAIEAGWIDYRSMALDPRFDSVRNTAEFENHIAHLRDKVAAMRRQASGQELASSETE